MPISCSPWNSVLLDKVLTASGTRSKRAAASLGTADAVAEVGGIVRVHLVYPFPLPDLLGQTSAEMPIHF